FGRSIPSESMKSPGNQSSAFAELSLHSAHTIQTVAFAATILYLGSRPGRRHLTICSYDTRIFMVSVPHGDAACLRIGATGRSSPGEAPARAEKASVAPGNAGRGWSG